MEITREISRRLNAFATWIAEKWAALDGLDITDYIHAIEREFEISIAPDDLGDIQTLDDMCLLVERIRAQGGQISNREDVWVAIRRITSFEMGLDAAELEPTTRYIEDLCC